MNRIIYVVIIMILCSAQSLSAAYEQFYNVYYDSAEIDVHSFFSHPNSTYIIQYEHCFKGTVTIPFSCRLVFKDSGMLSGPIFFDDTFLEGKVHLQGSSLMGRVRNSVFYSDWICYCDGINDDAVGINSAISVCDSIVFHSGTYFLNSFHSTNEKLPTDLRDKVKSHIGVFRSGIVLSGESGTVFFSDQPSCLLSMYSLPNSIPCSISNIVIEGITFESNNTGNEFHEFIHAVKLIGAKSVRIENCQFRRFWGDGICLSHYGDNPKTGERTLNENVRIIGCVIDGGPESKNRNAISVISGKNIVIDGNVISNVSSRNMPGAIDIEANNSAFTIDSIAVLNNRITKCRGGLGAICVVSKSDNAPAHNIIISGNSISSSRNGLFFLIDTVGSTSNFTIEDNVIEEDTIPYRFMGEGVSKRWIFRNNRFKKSSSQKLGGGITVLE